VPSLPAEERLNQLLTDQDFLIIGHRGAAGLAPENTLQSFSAALQWRCPMIELDVYARPATARRTELLVIHDDTVNRTTNGRGRVMEMSLADLRRLDAGGGQHIPLLSEVLALLREHDAAYGVDTALNIELKGPDTAAPTAAVVAASADTAMLVSSFDHAELAVFHRLLPTCPVAPLFDRWRRDWQETAGVLNAFAVNLSARIASNTRIRAIRDAGYAVFVYTVNAPDQARTLRAAGANGVFTDRPDLLMAMDSGR